MVWRAGSAARHASEHRRSLVGLAAEEGTRPLRDWGQVSGSPKPLPCEVYGACASRQASRKHAELPRYPISGRRGRASMPLSAMLRIHYYEAAVRDERPGDARRAYGVESMRAFAGLEQGEDASGRHDDPQVPSSPAGQRPPLETADCVDTHLKTKGLILRESTMVDATPPFSPHQARSMNCGNAIDEGQYYA